MKLYLSSYKLGDDPDISADGYGKEIVWEGLGLIDFAFAPHKSDHTESEAVDKEVEYYIKKGISYKALRDGEVIIQEI